MGNGSGIGVAVAVGIGVGSGAVSQATKATRNTGKASRVHRRRLIDVDIGYLQINDFTKLLSIIHRWRTRGTPSPLNIDNDETPHGTTLEGAILWGDPC